MKTIKSGCLTAAVKKLFLDANFHLGADVYNKMAQSLENETSELAREAITICLKNADLAGQNNTPLCQDTGTAVIFIEIGQEVYIDGNIEDALQKGVREAYRDGCLRKSIVSEPVFERKNTDDNTPAVIHYQIMPGTDIKITAAPKGGGAENMSKIFMLLPSAGREGIVKCVRSTIMEAGGNPCPPLIIGLGIGGNFETAPLLAKKALLREIGTRNRDMRYARLEIDLEDILNNTNIGPQGFGGKTTVLAVHVEFSSCHIASLPVAINIQCHSARHKSILL